MSLAIHLVDALKASLKRRGRTYAQLAAALNVSEATVKRDLSKGTLRLDRFARICEAAGVTLDELSEHVDARGEFTEQLSYSDEQRIVSDAKLWLVSLCVLNQWTFQEIQTRYAFTEPELIGYLLELDGIGILELHSENRIRLRLARSFRWLPDGPFIRTFREQLAKEFFDGTFDDDSATFRLVTGALSTASIQILMMRLRQIAEEIAALHIKDQRLPRERKTNITCVLAVRDWEPLVFQALQRR